MSASLPMRRCANHPTCTAIIRADAPTLHCAECHRTDPELIRMADAYTRRAELRSPSRTPGRVG